VVKYVARIAQLLGLFYDDCFDIGWIDGEGYTQYPPYVSMSNVYKKF